MLEFVKDSQIAEKLTKHDELTSPNFELESKKSLLKLDNDNLKKEAEDSRKELKIKTKYPLSCPKIFYSLLFQAKIDKVG